jgi:hypothetical protein
MRPSISIDNLHPHLRNKEKSDEQQSAMSLNKKWLQAKRSNPDTGDNSPEPKTFMQGS